MEFVVRRRPHDDTYTLSFHLEANSAETAALLTLGPLLQAKIEGGDVVGVASVNDLVHGTDLAVSPLSAEKAMSLERELVFMFQELALSIGITPPASGVVARYELGSLPERP